MNRFSARLPARPSSTLTGNERTLILLFSQVDVNSKLWICPFCLQRNQLPPHYANISVNNLPAELMPAYTTIEYHLPRGAAIPPIFFFVVDTCVSTEEDLVALKGALMVSLSLLPPKALVGLITFGTMVQVHELGSSDIPKSYVLRGTKDYSTGQIQEMLGLSAAGAPSSARASQGQAGQAGSFRFVMPLEMCELTLSSIFEQLQRDPWPVDSDKRSQRCTGVASSVAVSLLESLFPQSTARLMLFVGGPCTIGPGQVVGVELREAIRSHHDIEADTARHYSRACTFYDGLAKRAASNGLVVDLLVGSLDQAGIAEMKALANCTGGVIVMSESFSHNQFRNSVQGVFATAGSHRMLWNGSLEAVVSREMRVCGLVGPAIAKGTKHGAVSETEIGIGGTTEWRLCGLTPSSTYALYFEIQTTGPAGPTSRGLIQFITNYQAANGQYRVRVTTLARTLADPLDPNIVASFDQEAAAVLMARIAVYKAEMEDSPDVLRWLDKLLIRLCQRFGDFRRDDPSSFRLSELFSIYPQFMFHLRRSQFLQVFNNSPDETAYYRHVLNREAVTGSLIMIQPTLTSYLMDQPPHPVLLDSSSIRPDAILLLDSFFHIVIFFGAHIAQWRAQGFYDNPDYASFRALVDAPQADAKRLMEDRYPMPMYVVCNQGGSQSRFLISKLNPSTTHTNSPMPGGGMASAANPAAGGQPIFTDDVSLQVFFDHLKKLVVTGN